MDAMTSESKNALSQFLHSCSEARLGQYKDRNSYEMRCLDCGAPTLTVPGCQCQATFDYIAPGELAEWAVKAYPKESDRVLAERFKIGHATVSRARATVSNETVAPTGEKRTGRDGKKRKMPKRKDPAKQAEAAKAYLDDDARTLKEAAVAAGLRSEQGVKTGVAYEQGKRDAYTEVGALADLFKMNAKQKLNAAIRAHKKLLDREYDQRRTKEIQEHIKRIMPTLQEEKNAAYRRERDYREYLQKAKKAMTVAEYTLVCSLLHPDSRISASEERLRRAFQMFEPKKFALTGEK